jgi:hypothetical protein
MDGLTASLAATDPFWIDWDAGDWLRTEAAAAANALSESPQDAMAVALKATTTIDKAAILAPALLWIILNIPMPPFLSAIFLKFMLTSFATDPFAAAFYLVTISLGPS